MNQEKIKKVKALANDILGKLYLRPFITAARSLKILEIDYGHFKSSLKWSAIDADNQPIPWFSYPAVRYLSGLDLSNKNIFEYGAGNSTIFWASRCSSIKSVENNENWYMEVQDRIKKLNLTHKSKITLTKNKNSYIKNIDRYKNRFDVVVVDGFYRQSCAKRAVKRLSSDGMIILDNSDWFPKTCRFLRKSGLIQVDFTGFGPINPYTTTTSIFLTRDFDFSSKESVQPGHQPGGIKHLKG